MNLIPSSFGKPICVTLPLPDANEELKNDVDQLKPYMTYGELIFLALMVSYFSEDSIDRDIHINVDAFYDYMMQTIKEYTEDVTLGRPHHPTKIQQFEQLRIRLPEPVIPTHQTLEQHKERAAKLIECVIHGFKSQRSVDELLRSYAEVYHLGEPPKYTRTSIQLILIPRFEVPHETTKQESVGYHPA